MAPRVANARMYAVTPEVERLWASLLGTVAERAGVALRYESYAAPRPLEKLWEREDLGLAFMCGWPFANLYPAVQAIAAPIPAAGWAERRAAYRTDLVVRADGSIRSLADARGGTIGWTVEHSQSGYRAVAAFLQAETEQGWHPFARRVGPLVTPRAVLEAVLAGIVDVGPLDGYWHDLLSRHEPAQVGRVRTIASTPLTPMPLLVASAGMPTEQVEALRRALADASQSDPDTADLMSRLRLRGFAPVERRDYDPLLDAAASPVVADT